MPNNISTRSCKTQFRADPPVESGAPFIIEGYFVVFDQPYVMWDGCTEVVDRHAFDHADVSDVRVLVDHDSRLVLGRSTAGTADFEIDDTGVYVRCTINPDDQEAMNLRARVLRGDVDQASFGFEEDDVEYIDNPDGTVRRVIRGISKLWEFSVCTFPAYEQTIVSARSADSEKIRRDVLNHKKQKLKRRFLHHA